MGDKYLEVNFDKDSVHAGKAAAKEALQAECGLPVDPDVPVFGFIGRLEEQKGVDILMEALPGLMEAAECQVVILGTGKKAMETQLKALSAKFPGRVKGIAKFSTPLAHTINAGADFLLVPRASSRAGSSSCTPCSTARCPSWPPPAGSSTRSRRASPGSTWAAWTPTTWCPPTWPR